MDSSKNKKNKAEQFNIKNNNRRYIIEKYNISSKYDSYESNINKRYDDYYILHSLKNIVKKINSIKKENNNTEVLLIAKNSGKPAQLKKGKYKYIKIEFKENLSYKEIDYDYTDDIYLFLDENKICFFEIGVFLELYNNLKSYEQFKYTTSSEVFYIYQIINKIISPYKLIYDNYRFLNKEISYKDIIKDIKENDFEPIIKDREIERLKKVMQEYFDNNKKTASILPSYRLSKEDKKKDTRYYTLESLIVLDEILRIYKDIKTTDFVFIRNISYLDDAEEIAKEIFNFDKILNLDMYSSSEKYIKDICLDISNDKERQKEIKKSDIKNIFNNFKNISITDLENIIFYLYNTILNLINDNKNYNVEEDEALQKGILYYDNVFHYLQYFIGYLFNKEIINKKEYKKIIELYIYKYNTLRSHNIYRFYKFYLNNETAKKYNIENYGMINDYVYYYQNEEKIVKNYSIYDYKDIYIYYYKFILMSIAYNIIGYNRDEKDYINRIKDEFKEIKNYINQFNKMLNNLYFVNVIDYEEYKKYDYYKLRELINDICDLIQDKETFINIEENIKNFEVYQLIIKEIESIKESKIIYDRYKLFYFFLEEEYKLSYDNTEDIIKKIDNFYNIYKSIEIPIKK